MKINASFLDALKFMLKHLFFYLNTYLSKRKNEDSALDKDKK